MTMKPKLAVPSLTQPTRRPMTAPGRKPVTQPTRPGSSTVSAQQRPTAPVRRPVSSSTAKQTQPIVRPISSTGQARQRPTPTTSTTSRVPPTARPAVVNSAKPRTGIQRPVTSRPVLGQTRPNVKPQPVPEPLLKCEDVGFEL